MTEAEKKEDEEVPAPIADNDLDLLNLYVKELREPLYQEVSQNKKTLSPKPCTDYTRIYLPNGQ